MGFPIQLCHPQSSAQFVGRTCVNVGEVEFDYAL